MTAFPLYAETADLLEISFFATKDEAVKAAGGHAVGTVDTEPPDEIFYGTGIWWG